MEKSTPSPKSSNAPLLTASQLRELLVVAVGLIKYRETQDVFPDEFARIEAALAPGAVADEAQTGQSAPEVNLERLKSIELEFILLKTDAEGIVSEAGGEYYEEAARKIAVIAYEVGLMLSMQIGAARPHDP